MQYNFRHNFPYVIVKKFDRKALIKAFALVFILVFTNKLFKQFSKSYLQAQLLQLRAKQNQHRHSIQLFNQRFKPKVFTIKALIFDKENINNTAKEQSQYCDLNRKSFLEIALRTIKYLSMVPKKCLILVSFFKKTSSFLSWPRQSSKVENWTFVKNL